jgi:transposase
VTRRLAHEPLGWRSTTLLITIRRYRCTGCGMCGRQDTSRAAAPRAKLSRRALRWALEGIVCQHLTVAWVAEGRRVLIEDPHRFEGARMIGVDEHCWHHTRRGDKYVTVMIIDLTPIRNGTGPARLLDMVEGRSKQVFKAWLGKRGHVLARRRRGGCDGRVHRFQDRHHEELPDTVAVMDPFHVVRLAGDALDQCRYLGTCRLACDDIARCFAASPSHTRCWMAKIRPPAGLTAPGAVGCQLLPGLAGGNTVHGFDNGPHRPEGARGTARAHSLDPFPDDH